MNIPLKFSPSVIEELEDVVRDGKPIAVTERGELYALANLPVGAIRLKVPLVEYLAFIESLEENKKPPERFLVPHDGKVFQIIVNAAVTRGEQGLLVAGLPVTII
jgi:hypothetical protein